MKTAVVTYCTLSYLDAYEFTVPSWIHKGFNTITVYVDSAEFIRRCSKHSGVRIVHAFEKSDDITLSFVRKIETIDKFVQASMNDVDCFIFLDSDCFVRQSVLEVFDQMKGIDVIGTRLLGRTNRGKGAANSGVIFFRMGPKLRSFIRDWKELTSQYMASGPAFKVLAEQAAYSELMIKAFDGMCPYRSSLVSERIYNCEHDDDIKWLRDIRLYSPKILHFKGRRFRNAALVKQVFSVLGS